MDFRMLGFSLAMGLPFVPELTFCFPRRRSSAYSSNGPIWDGTRLGRELFFVLVCLSGVTRLYCSNLRLRHGL